MSRSTSAPSVATVDALVEALLTNRLLEPSQVAELASLQAACTEPRALARELVRRGWLTPYQVNQLFQGRGQDLLLRSYVLLERLGQGGMGEVFKARNWKLGRVVALKLIRKERLAHPDALRRFEREIRAAAHLHHPNIVQAFDADQAGETHFFTMEYVPGIDLARLVKQQGPLPVERACEYVRQAALGLQHAQEKGMVHRDIKPHNLLLTPNGTVKLLDLGLARLAAPAEGQSASSLTQEGTVMGTVDFIAPEQAMDSSSVDIRADLYSLGCTLYFLLTGRVPFPGAEVLPKLLKHRLEEPVPVEQLRPDVPAPVAVVVRKLMAKRPEDRYQTPAELAAILSAGGPGGAAAGGNPARTPAPAPPAAANGGAGVTWSGWANLPGPEDTVVAPAKPPEGIRRRPYLGAAVLAALLLGAMALAAFVVTRRAHPPGRGEGGTPESLTHQDPEAATPGAVVIEHANEAYRVRTPAYEAVVESDGCLTSLRIGGVEFLKTGAGPPPGVSRGSYFYLNNAVLRLPRVAQPAAHVITAWGDQAHVRYEFRPDSVVMELTNRGNQDLQRFIIFDPAVTAVRKERGPWASLPLNGRWGPASWEKGESALIWFAGRSKLTITGETSAWGPWENRYQVWEARLAPGEKRQVVLRPGCPTDEEAGEVAVVAGAKSRAEAEPPATDEASEAAWKALSARGADPKVAREAVRAEALALQRQHGGTAAALRAAALLHQLPSPLDGLKQEIIPADEPGTASGGDAARAPSGLVAVLGDSRLRHWGRIRSVNFGTGGETVASSGEDGTVKLWDLETGRALLSLDAGVMAVSGDGTTLAVDGPGGTVRLRDLAAGRGLRTIATTLEKAETLALSGDGKTLAIGGAGKVRLWDVPAGKELPATFAGNLKALSADGKTVAVATENALQLGDVATGKEQRTFAVPRDARAAFSPDGKTLATWLGEESKLWDAVTGQERHSWKAHRWGIESVVFSPDGRTLATSGHDQFIRLWAADTAERVRDVWGAGIDVPIAFSPDGLTLASGGDCPVRLWAVATGQEKQVLKESRGSFGAVALSPDGQALLLGTLDGQLQVWDVPAPEGPRPFARPENPIWEMAFSPDGKTLATAREGEMRFWSQANGQEMSLLPGGPGAVRVLGFHPDGRRVVAAHEGSMDTLRLWDLTSGTELRAFSKLPARSCWWPSISPDGRLLAAGSDVQPGAIRVWDLATGEERYTLAEATQTTTVRFSPDGKILAALHYTVGRVYLWDATLPQQLPGPNGTCFAFRPDSKVLAAADGGTVRFWDLALGKEESSLRVGPPRGTIRQLAYSPDGRYLVTTNGNGTVYVLRLAPPPAEAK